MKKTFLFLFISSFLSNAQQFDIDKLKNIKTRSIGPAGNSGRVTTLDVFIDNPEIIYIKTASGGL